MKPEQPKKDQASDYLSWGITLLNLACYGRIGWGLKKGHVYRVAGGSSSGKTFLCRTVLAEAVRSPFFGDYELVYDDVERGALMDTAKFFGQSLVDRLVPPAWSEPGVPYYSQSIGEFYNSLAGKLKKRKKVVWVEDSMDALSPMAESKMGDGKAKFNSQELRKVIDPLQETQSILLLVSQAHVDLKAATMFPSEVASGGRALEFYSTLDVWLKKGPPIVKSYKGKKYTVGMWVRARVKKNRLSGMDRTITFPFSPGYGIDDVGANVEFLASSGHWKRDKDGTLTAPEFDHQGSVETLIDKIEDQTKERDLAVLTSKVWKEIESNISQERKRRYE